MPRRIIDRALAHALVDSLAVGEPLDQTIIARYVESACFWHDVDPATAQEKFDRILQLHRERFTWRPVG